MRHAVLCIGLLSVSMLCAYDQPVRAITDEVKPPVGTQKRLTVERDPRGWYVRDHNKGKVQRLQQSDVDSNIRNMSPHQFAKMMKTGRYYMTLNQCDDGSYKVYYKPRAKGGGPICGAIAYGTVLGFGVAVPIVGSATLGIVTAEAARNGGNCTLGDIEAQKETTKQSIKATSKYAAKVAQNAPAGTGHACNAIVESGAHEAAAYGTLAGATEVAATSYVATVQAWAASAAAYMTAIPWLP